MFFIFNKFKHIVINQTNILKKYFYIKKIYKISKSSDFLYDILFCYVYSNHSIKKIKLDFNIRLILNLERLKQQGN